MRFRVLNGCPCPASIAPYVHIVLQGAGQTANSIYRGPDAARLLHRHGKHTQAELYATLPAGQANPPGQSTHELRSDGFAYPRTPARHKLDEWQQGVDSGADTSHARAMVNESAARHGWHTFHPYKSGVEGHHWNFHQRPRPRGIRMRLRIIHLRATLPRH